MANEFFRFFGTDAGVSLTPADGGRLEVYLDGEKVYDRKAEGNKLPDLTRVREMKQLIQAKLDSVLAVAND